MRREGQAPGKGAELVRLVDVSKTFGTKEASHTVLQDVNFSIVSGEFFILLGPSGCGKTTLLRLLGGFEYPTTGIIALDGVDLSNVAPHRRPINTVFQSYALFPHMTVRQNVAYGLRMLKWPTDKLNARVSEVLELVRLSQFEGRRPAQLSGGQQQRVALARALAPSPRLLLLDEPLSALDLKLRKGMQAELKRLQRETGITFVLVTHDQEEALAMADRVAVVDGGRVLQIGPPEDVYTKPTNPFVADFIGEANLVAGELFGRPGMVLALRQESLTFSPGPGRMRGVVSAITFLGSDILYEVKVGEGQADLRMRGRRETTPKLDVGAEVFVDWAEASEWWMSK
ncbi:ABC transporter ATP-binding protein [Rhizobium sp. AG855]|uniref:ABC transporter ATP-binding protein n=1 Tax=Rhizobium sp. AG855 TaxID=2183898 RepID=UPI000E71A58C|nr:ABC transporter ATP-binding protein [Rhizobium sp. AG855]